MLEYFLGNGIARIRPKQLSIQFKIILKLPKYLVSLFFKWCDNIHLVKAWDRSVEPTTKSLFSLFFLYNLSLSLLFCFFSSQHLPKIKPTSTNCERKRNTSILIFLIFFKNKCVWFPWKKKKLNYVRLNVEVLFHLFHLLWWWI